MSEETRKIVAILFSDIVGYTAVMGRDEEAALSAVSRARRVQKELVRKFHGEWLQEQGDGVLCTFGSAVEAVNCALEIQRAFEGEADFQLRIGIHVGDLIFRPTESGPPDVFGDGVNVASRVQGVADAGGICVSERVFDDLRNRRGIETRFLGQKQLKNVNRPIGVYRVIDREAREGRGAGHEAQPQAERRRPLLAVAGVAVLALAGVGLYLGLGGSQQPPPRGPLTGVAPGPSQAPGAPEVAGKAKSPSGEGPTIAVVEPADGTGPPALVVVPPRTAPAAKPSPSAAPTPDFASARRELLAASGPFSAARARVWTEPDPVRDSETYRVRFQADCACQALLFAVDGSSDEISLLYPNPYEPPRALQPGRAAEIPSSGAYKLRAVGGRGTDTLKLFVAREGFAFPPAGVDSWAATPEQPERLAELNRFLASLEGDWASALTPLTIVR